MKRNKFYSGLAGFLSLFGGINSQGADEKDTPSKKDSVSAYVEEFPTEPITLEDILSASKTSKEDFGAPEVVLAYARADWCGFCQQLDKINYWENVKKTFENKPVGFVKIDLTEKEFEPSILPKIKYQKELPQVAVLGKRGGEYVYLGDVNLGEPEPNTKKMAGLALEGRLVQPKTIKINAEGFRYFQQGFSLTDSSDDTYPEYDRIAVLSALARFGNGKIKYDKETGEAVVVLNFYTPSEFRFARIYDFDPNVPKNGDRNVLFNIMIDVKGRSISKQEADPAYKSLVETIDNSIGGFYNYFYTHDIASLSEEELIARQLMFVVAQSNQADLRNDLLPEYIRTPYLRSVLGSQTIFFGSVDEYSILGDFTSQKIRESLKKWAKDNGKILDIKRFHTEEELKKWGEGNGVPSEEVGSLIRTREKLLGMYRTYDSYGIDYAGDDIPFPPIHDLLKKEKKAAVIRLFPRADNIESVLRAAATPVELTDTQDFLEVFIRGVDEIRRLEKDNNISNDQGIGFYISPYVSTNLGSVPHPYSGGPGSFTDSISDANHGSLIIICKDGKPVYRIPSYQRANLSEFIEKLKK